MYLIGPLLFWACAEMTCGFFIFSVPCLSKLMIESGLPRRFKNALGFSSRSGNPSNENSNTGPRYGSHPISRPSISKPWVTTDSTYSKIDEGSIALRNTERSESQTHLHDGAQAHQGKGALQVTRTTDITITTDSHSHSGSERENDSWD